MIDIHHHLIYGMDDGARDIDESVAMAAMAAEDGITHIVCTPHASHRYEFVPEKNAEHLDRLRERLGSAGIDVTLGQGCDFHLTWDNIQDAKANPSKYSINGNKYLLVEIPELVLPMGIRNTFNELQYAGFIPILTHPERVPVLQKAPERMKPWLEDGVLVQVTASSLLGRFGSTAQKMSQRMLRDNWVHFIATDAHNTKSRAPKMKEAFDWICGAHGEATAQRLCVDNPKAAYEGKALGRQPRLIGVDDEEYLPPKRSWLSRVLGR